VNACDDGSGEEDNLNINDLPGSQLQSQAELHGHYSSYENSISGPEHISRTTITMFMEDYC
jgi:hypothetical protein